MLLSITALLACGEPKRREGDYDKVRTVCAANPAFDLSASNDAMGRLRREGCRATLFWSGCEDWWERVVTVCSFDEAGETRIEVHSSLVRDTPKARQYREAMCDGVRNNVSGSAPAAVYDAHGKRVTTCAKRRGK